MKTFFTVSVVDLSITIEGSENNKYLRLYYNSKYASGSIPIPSVEHVVDAIEDICGKGSFCLYQGKGEQYPKVVDYFEARELSFPKITYWMQGIKTDLIETIRKAMIEAWGESKETEIGWLENQCRSYIEDIK